ncbi:MAG TPA: glycosyltransferase [Actinomycetota bacterium]|nr:glycosyltransferase [Actinomycetota bacterium]
MPTILFVTCHLPYPLISGGRRREYELLTRLARRFRVHLVAVTKTYGEDVENSIVFEDTCESVTVLPAVMSGAKRDPLQVRKHSCPAATATIDRLIADHDVDVVHVEGFYMLQHIPPSASVPVFLQEQNIEYLLWKQRATQSEDADDRAACLWEYFATLEAETRAWERADLCGALTHEDVDVMQAPLPRGKVRLVPDGFDHLGRATEIGAGEDRAAARRVRRRLRTSDPEAVVFVGNFAYQPNIDAARYLVEDIWPYVTHHRPDTKLILVGNSPPREIESLAKKMSSVEVTGRVPDVTPYLDLADLFVCPLRIGGGIKVKVLEALCRGKAIVTTSVGAQGIERASSAMVVEDDPHDFARAMVRLLRSDDARRTLEKRAAARASLLPTWDDAAEALMSAYETLLRTDAAPGRPAGGASTFPDPARPTGRPGSRARRRDA